MNFTFSIIIPVYNPAEYLEKCLTSVMSQSYKNCEIILIDDGSTDGSGEACDRFARDHPDIETHVIHQTNSGCAPS